MPLTATLQLVEMLAGDASADVVARTRWFASPMASREATQSSIDFRRFAKMSWRQRCLALHRLTRVAAPSFESSFSGQMSEANLEWRARAQLYCGPHVREEASAAAAAAAEALPSAASASSADAKKSKSLLVYKEQKRKKSMMLLSLLLKSCPKPKRLSRQKTKS